MKATSGEIAGVVLLKPRYSGTNKGFSSKVQFALLDEFSPVDYR